MTAKSNRERDELAAPFRDRRPNHVAERLTAVEGAATELKTTVSALSARVDSVQTLAGTTARDVGEILGIVRGAKSAGKWTVRFATWVAPIVTAFAAWWATMKGMGK